MISADKKILEEGSAAQERHFEYGKICDELHIVVLGNTNLRETEHEFTRSSNVRIYGVQGSSKITRLWNGYKKAKAIVERGRGRVVLDVPPQSPSGTAALARNIDLVTTQDAGFTGLIGYFLKKKYEVNPAPFRQSWWTRLIIFSGKRSIFPKRCGVKLNIQIHGQEEKLINKILLSPFKKRIIKSADSIRVVSERLKIMVAEKYSITDKKIYVVPIYSEFAGKLRNLKFEIRNCESKKDFNILTVGRLVKVKNIGLQIEALADVVKIFPDTRLVIVGDGPEKENLQKIAKKFKVEDKVEFAGRVDNGRVKGPDLPMGRAAPFFAKGGVDPAMRRRFNLGEYYRKADLFVLTSNDEGWGMVIIEAMAAGVPVIMTAVGCAGEIVKNGKNGIVIPTGDRKALVAAICDMIADVEKREKFSKNGKTVVDNLPDKQDTLEMYREMWGF